MDLADKPIEKIAEGATPFDTEGARQLAFDIPDWTVRKGAIERLFKFANFREAMVFVNRVAEVAEAAHHHPDIWISYNKVQLELATRKIGGLSMNDFIVAARIDRLPTF
jgi:4a-hydroxytetrahydrobiopterin dehydratase